MQGTGYPVPGQSSASAGSFQTDPKYLGQLMMNPDPKYLSGLVDSGVQSQMETKYSNHLNSGEPESKYHSNPESKYQSSEDKYHQSQEKQQQQQQQYLGQLAAASGSMMCRPVH